LASQTASSANGRRGLIDVDSTGRSGSVLGEPLPDYATSLNSLGASYKMMGDYARAEPLYRQALELRKNGLGEAHPGRTVPPGHPTIMPATVVAQRGGFRALPATGPEAQSARDLFHATFADQPAEVLTGALPTEAELKRRLDGGRWRVVHLATHGFFESPTRILALRGCDLVVLSACETGLGNLESGQGVLGLQRAFQAAGARAVVASLWKVDDAATGVLMDRFYSNLWTRKLPTLEALRQAQLAVLNDPGLVEAHRGTLAQRGLGPKAEKLEQGGDGGSTSPSGAERPRPVGGIRARRRRAVRDQGNESPPR
jgi:hypothetical protein